MHGSAECGRVNARPAVFYHQKLGYDRHAQRTLGHRASFGSASGCSVTSSSRARVTLTMLK